ncbi:unnamed protein product [Pleuronectes platessa]|uniref:Uncharacterized protein n=1 Tax=Pleuronectes platessa TaxID=8262 RepID=A0A9N7TNY9_PLEPL|nr:unnamed protein product [Pleuronectes platessa]
MSHDLFKEEARGSSVSLLQRTRVSGGNRTRPRFVKLNIIMGSSMFPDRFYLDQMPLDFLSASALFEKTQGLSLGRLNHMSCCSSCERPSHRKCSCFTGETLAPEGKWTRGTSSS